MDRTTISQAVAMLVILWALFRALPSGLERFDTLMGYGDWEHMLFVDNEVWSNRGNTLMVRSQARGMVRGMGPIDQARVSELLKCERFVHRQAQPDDLVQLKGVMGNEAYVLQYYLYPLRSTSYYLEQGSRGNDPTRADANWIITGGAVPKAWRANAPAPSDEAWEASPSDGGVPDDDGSPAGPR